MATMGILLPVPAARPTPLARPTLLDPARVRGEHRRHLIDEVRTGRLEHRPLAVERGVGERDCVAQHERLALERAAHRLEHHARSLDQLAAVGAPRIDATGAELALLDEHVERALPRGLPAIADLRGRDAEQDVLDGTIDPVTER